MADDPRDLYYLAASVRELDRLAIEEHHIPGFTLMRRAGKAAFDAMLDRWPSTRHVRCFCGSGNNGGDGYVIAALAAEKGIDAAVIAVGNPGALKGDAGQARELAVSLGVPVVPFREFLASGMGAVETETVLVDAMLGTGLTGDVRGDYLDAITLVNGSGCPVLAVDIPSGLCSDTGVVLGDAVSADLTVTFIGKKPGQVVADGPARCGDIVFDDLGVPDAVYAGVEPATP